MGQAIGIDEAHRSLQQLVIDGVCARHPALAVGQAYQGHRRIAVEGLGRLELCAQCRLLFASQQHDQAIGLALASQLRRGVQFETGGAGHLAQLTDQGQGTAVRVGRVQHDELEHQLALRPTSRV
ncbi:hypothetical protein D3C79_903950 [compost metagenome]